MSRKHRKKKRIETSREHPPFAPINNRPPVTVPRQPFRPMRL
jgi:hypothetical protein